LLSGLERIFALVIQICLTMLVLYSIKARKISFFILAILAHALIDFIPALYQAHFIGLVTVEIILGLFAAIAFTLFLKSRKHFE
jgi:uncharacterized membrane protein YhfC